MFSDDFISYDNEVNVKLEKSSDHDISLNSPSLKTCESTPNLLPLNFSPNLQSLLTQSVSYAGMVQKKRLPFTIIRTNKVDTFDHDFDHVEVKIETEEKILNKSKLIMKREKAKQRAMSRLNKPICLKIEADVESEIPDTPVGVGEVKNKKKILQMIRNRISAQTSRDRKKAYLYQLEDAKNKLYTENSLLKQQNTSLLQEISKLKEANQRMAQQNEGLKNGSGLDIDLINGRSNTIENVVRNIMGNNGFNTSGAFAQDKDRLGEVYNIASVLSNLVCNQVGVMNPKVNETFTESKINKDIMRDEDDDLLNTNKLDMKSGFDKINNDDSIFNYSSDLINEKQNTIFHHLTGMPKSNKNTFFKPQKDNYSADQTIFSLTNFNLSDKSTEFPSLKDLKQEDSQYSFGIKHSNLL